MNKQEQTNWLIDNVKINTSYVREDGCKKHCSEIYKAVKEFGLINPGIQQLPFPQQVYCYCFDVIEVPKCKQCNKIITRYNGFYLGFNKFCSKKCSAINEHTREARKETCLKEYEVENVLKSKEIQRQIKETNLRKYGAEIASKSDLIKSKTKQYFIDKFGVDNPFKSEEVKKKIKETLQEKYGVDYPGQSKEIREKAKQTLIESYGVDVIFKSKEFKETTKAFYLQKYGVENPSQVTKTTEKRTHSGYRFKEYKLPSGNIVKIQGFENLALDFLLKSGIKENDIKISRTEIELEVGKIFYEYQQKIKRYFPDLYIKPLNKIIEVKSTYTIKTNQEINKLKREACLRQGLNFEYLVFDFKKRLVKEE